MQITGRLLLLIASAFLVLTTGWVTSAKASSDFDNSGRFYGKQSLNPLNDQDTVIVSLPGGTQVLIKNNQTDYVVTDHLRSTRLTMADDNTVSEAIDYTPFGDRPKANDTGESGEINITQGYTGQVFEPETATYDYHARGYDPSAGRFTSVDDARESISPYSYTENNPINFVDPNGLGRSLFLYSIYGVDVPDSSGVTSVKERREKIIDTLSKTPDSTKVIISKLEDSRPISIPSGEEITHLHVSSHGNPTVIPIYNSKRGKVEKLNGKKFALYLNDRLRGNEDSITTLKSIFLDSCKTGLCVKQPDGTTESSFADEFASQAKDLFPNLEDVFATSYLSATRISQQDDNIAVVRIFNGPDDREKFFAAAVAVNKDRFFSGNIEPKLLEPLNSISGVGLFKKDILPTSHPDYHKYNPITSDTERSNLLRPGNRFFKEPFYRKIPIVRPEFGLSPANL